MACFTNYSPTASEASCGAIYRLVSATSVHKSTISGRKVPQFDENRGSNISHKNASHDKKSYTATIGTDWIFSLTLLFFSKPFYLIQIYAKCVERFSKKNTKLKLMKIDHFLGQFPGRKSKIRQIKNISWRSAWKNEENVHLRFLIFENSPQRYLQNKLRDFQKSLNYEWGAYLLMSSTL